MVLGHEQGQSVSWLKPCSSHQPADHLVRPVCRAQSWGLPALWAAEDSWQQQVAERGRQGCWSCWHRHPLQHGVPSPEEGGGKGQFGGQTEDVPFCACLLFRELLLLQG